VFLFEIFGFTPATNVLSLPPNPGCVPGGLRFREFCENVNNFSSKKFLPATAFREKVLLSSTLTGSRAGRKIVPILPAA